MYVNIGSNTCKTARIGQAEHDQRTANARPDLVIRSRASRAETGPAILCRDRPAAAAPRHCPAAKLSWEHAGALAAGGNAWRRAQFAPLLALTGHISPCYEYRERQAGESAEAYGLRAALALKDEILRLGPETVMAFFAEPVVGATAGAVPAVPGYLRRIRDTCDRYGVLLILDEVMCGIGRTGRRSEPRQSIGLARGTNTSTLAL